MIPLVVESKILGIIGFDDISARAMVIASSLICIALALD